MASCPITSWQIEGEKMEAVTDFLFLSSKLITLLTKVLVKAMFFPVVMYGCESWTKKKAACERIEAFELWGWRRLLRMDCKEIKPVNPKGNQSWVFIGRTDAEAETPILWPPDVKNQLIGKDLDAGQGWRQKEKRATEDKMVGWHHRFTGHELEQTLGDGEGQGGLARCSPWGCTELDMTLRLNNINAKIIFVLYPESGSCACIQLKKLYLNIGLILKSSKCFINGNIFSCKLFWISRAVPYNNVTVFFFLTIQMWS